jgi:putative hemolysin
MSWIILLSLLVACSFLVSGSETALFALTPQDRRLFADSPSRLRQLATRLMQRPRRVLMTVLIVNTAVNVGIFAVSFVRSGAEQGGSTGASALTGALALLVVILLGEIVPKALALANARRLAPLIAPFIAVLQFITAPIAWILHGFVIEPLVRLISPHSAKPKAVPLQDLAELVKLSAQQGVITSQEFDMLQAVVALPEISVRSIMVPRVRLEAIAEDALREQVESFFSQSGLAKVPVYGKDLDDIRGLLHARDFHLRPNETIERILRPVHYVPEVINVLQLVRHFQQTGTQIALVVDEYGGIAGLVTLEDVVKEIVGDLDTDQSRRTTAIERIDDRSYRIAGAHSIRSWRATLGLTHRLLDVDTFGGVVVAELSRMPRVGDRVTFGNLTLIVDALDGRRIAWVVLHAEPVAGDPSAMTDMGGDKTGENRQDTDS